MLRGLTIFRTSQNMREIKNMNYYVHTTSTCIVMHLRKIHLIRQSAKISTFTVSIFTKKKSLVKAGTTSCDAFVSIALLASVVFSVERICHLR